MKEARDHVHMIVDRLMDLAINLADSPHGRDLENYEFRDYYFKFKLVSGTWHGLMQALFEVYVARREESKQ